MARKSEEQERIVRFLRQHKVAVLSTADVQGKPHGATIYYTLDPDSMNFFFVTKQNTTKSRNLEQNARAALTVYEAGTQTTVQITGMVKVEQEPAVVEAVFSAVLNAVLVTSDIYASPPPAQLHGGDYITYRLIPDSVRMAVFSRPSSADHDKIFEVI